MAKANLPPAGVAEPISDSTESIRRLSGLALSLVLFVALAWLFRGFYIDDALISLRYVQQFLAGNGLVYNLGERVEGYSNFLWVLLVAVGGRLGGPLGIDLVLVSKGLGFALSLVTLWLVWRLARPLPFAWVAPLLLAVSAPFVAWSVGGLETPLFACLLAAASVVFLHEEDQQRGWLAGVLFGLLALTRPEGLLFAVVAAGFRAVRLARVGRRPNRDEWLGGLSVIAIVGPYLIWRLLYYGYPLPNTVYAKSMGLLNPRGWMEGLYYLYGSVAASGGWMALAVPAGLALAQPNPPPRTVYLAANVAAYGAFIAASGGDWMPLQRFLVHILPLVVVLVQTGLVQLRALWPGRWKNVIVGAVVAGQVAFLLSGLLEQRFLNSVGSGPAALQDSPMADYLLTHLAPGDAIAVDVAGELAYRLPLEIRLIDLNGLTDAHIAHQPAQFPGGLFGRGDGFGKWDVDYVLAQAPRYMQISVTGQDAAGDYTTLNTGQTLLANDARFRALYRPLPEPELTGLFERR